MLRGSQESQQRKLLAIGAVVVALLAATGFMVVREPVDGIPPGRISIVIDSPFVGQGVRVGTPLVMHGVEMGLVTAKSTLPGGGTQLVSQVDARSVDGLTDTMQIDFRPVNYFGVTGINIVPGPGGQQLRDGTRVVTIPRGNSTLQALLTQLGQVSVSSLSPELISVIDRTVRYTDALNPLVETLLVFTKAVDDVQNVSTAHLLANATDISAALPGFTDVSVAAIAKMTRVPRDFSDDEWNDGPKAATREAAIGVFGPASRLLGNYMDSLLPTIDGLKTLTDTVPVLVRPAEFANTLETLRTRLEKMFAGNDEQRALQVQIVLDSLPGVAAPAAIMGAPR